jgi:hypothetical protein
MSFVWVFIPSSFNAGCFALSKLHRPRTKINPVNPLSNQEIGQWFLL